MSEIDWSKAPEGCTHFLPETSECAWFPCWVKEDGSVYYIMLADGIDTSWEHDDEMDDCIPHLVKRPSPAWSGEGLPPVGAAVDCKCTAKTKARDWFPAEVKYISPYTVVLVDYSTEELDGEFVAHPATLLFQPRRTTEQIAADEREAAIKAACLAVEGKIEKYNTRLDCSVAIRATIEAMIDEGYRKQEGK